jgi:glycosyltransferase involved in cell wall biosynthesis
MPKIVHLSNHEVSIRVHMRNYMRHLKNQGYEVSIICNPGDNLTRDTVTTDGIFVKVIPFPSSITPWQDMKTFFALLRYMRQERFHVVHTHTIKPGLLGRIAGRMAGIPVVLHTIHGFHFHEHMHPLARQFYASVERVSAGFCDMLLSQNEEDIATAVRMCICPEEKLRLLGNGIDIETFHPSRVTKELVRAKREELGIGADEKIVGMMGRLVRDKGYDDYFRAAKILKERGLKAVFLAMGVRHYKRGAIDPERMVSELGLNGYARFLGLRNDVPDLMAAMDLVVLPSWAEGISRSLMEAAALGKPVVATEVRGTRETVIDGETGVLVPVRNPERLAQAIEEILCSPERAQQMGNAARRRAEERFDERAFFVKTDQFYRHLLHNKAPSVSLDELKAI